MWIIWVSLKKNPKHLSLFQTLLLLKDFIICSRNHNASLHLIHHCFSFLSGWKNHQWTFLTFSFIHWLSVRSSQHQRKKLTSHFISSLSALEIFWEQLQPFCLLLFFFQRAISVLWFPLKEPFYHSIQLALKWGLKRMGTYSTYWSCSDRACVKHFSRSFHHLTFWHTVAAIGRGASATNREARLLEAERRAPEGWRGYSCHSSS